MDHYRAFTYLRYFGAYFGPILMLGLIWLKREQEVYCQCIGVIFSASWLLHLIWCTYILPYISGFSGTVMDYAPYSLTQGWTDSLSRSSYMVATVIVIVLAYIMYFLIKHKKGTAVVGILACLFLYEYCYNAVYCEGWRGKTNYEYLYDSCQVMATLEKGGLLPEKIYVVRKSLPVTTQGIEYQYQFMLPKQKMISGLPAEEEDAVSETSVILTIESNINISLIKRGYCFFQLGEKQYAYIRGEKQQELLDLGRYQFGIREFVLRLYTEALGYQGESTEIDYWTNQIRTNIMTAEEVAKSLFLSEEFEKRNLDDADYVEVLYRTFMGRASDAAGKEFWIQQLKDGILREEVLEGFSYSDEFEAIMIGYGL